MTQHSVYGTITTPPMAFDPVSRCYTFDLDMSTSECSSVVRLPLQLCWSGQKAYFHWSPGQLSSFVVKHYTTNRTTVFFCENTIDLDLGKKYFVLGDNLAQGWVLDCLYDCHTDIVFFLFGDGKVPFPKQFALVIKNGRPTNPAKNSCQVCHLPVAWGSCDPDIRELACSSVVCKVHMGLIQEWHSSEFGKGVI